ncbi:nucleotide-binding universal stress UspA family protein [Nocardioides sp. BE266]|uniref:universal stress protein n=1 Tax=Nocardioides sp. BE266 TaxID=2817725 RepID=UPI002854A7B6|nr:universal stress protein [Nocardioides sp. BE266]MDR7255143.1 nucleotide-binding universal stress UspA family protein [Nocardioides sp. BE266]
MSSRNHDVVVGVDGTPASANAIRYARAEAARNGGAVDVVHVVPDVPALSGFQPVPPDELMAAGRAALEASLALAGPPPRRVEERSHLRRGHVVPLLTEAGRTARAVVLGSDRRPVSMRLLTGNVSTGVSARSTVPVVSVPETWSVDRDTRVVVVGVKHPEHAGALLTEAFEVARERRSRLVVLHAWRLPIAYDDLLAGDPGTVQDWAGRAVRELEDAIAPWRSSHPDVDVELRCVHDQAAHALVTASEEADELLLVRRSHGLPAAAHLGSTARAVLLYAHCPIRVVPAVHVPVLLDLDLEAAGAPLERASS